MYTVEKPVQKDERLSAPKSNLTGKSDTPNARIETGFAPVHYNAGKPTQLQTNIHSSSPNESNSVIQFVGPSDKRSTNPEGETTTKKSGDFMRRFWWDLDETEQNGFILQKIKRENIVGEGKENACYYEAWTVSNGKISALIEGEDILLPPRMFHDTWSLKDDNALLDRVGFRGRTQMKGKVYWVPEGTDLYTEIEGWTGTVPNAGGLRSKSIEDFDDDLLKDLVPTVHDFAHNWDLRTPEMFAAAIIEKDKWQFYDEIDDAPFYVKKSIDDIKLKINKYAERFVLRNPERTVNDISQSMAESIHAKLPKPEDLEE